MNRPSWILAHIRWFLPTRQTHTIAPFFCPLLCASFRAQALLSEIVCVLFHPLFAINSGLFCVLVEDGPRAAGHRMGNLNSINQCNPHTRPCFVQVVLTPCHSHYTTEIIIIIVTSHPPLHWRRLWFNGNSEGLKIEWQGWICIEYGNGCTPEAPDQTPNDTTTSRYNDKVPHFLHCLLMRNNSSGDLF